MNETLGFMVAVFVVLAIAARHIIGENRDLKAENSAYKKTNANLFNKVMTLNQRVEHLQYELGATADAEAEEWER